MLFRRFLGPRPAAQGDAPPSTPAAPTGAAAADTATVRRIVARLESLPPDKARYLAAFAYVMSRAAHADLDISVAETAAMERTIAELGGLDEPGSVLVVEMAKLQARLHGATEDFLVTREFGRIASHDQKLALLRCCYAIGAADETITAEEASVVNEIARELDLSRDDVNAVRAEFVDRLSAIQAMRRMKPRPED
jgi:uncharacterized tellurite resistance protein B-like protein